MRFAPTEDQLALRDAVVDVLTRECPPSLVRSATDDPTAGRPMWSTLAEMGVLDALASEESGGMGFGLSDITPLARAAGMAALPMPFVEHVFLAAPALGALGDLVVTATDGSLLPYSALADRALLVRDGRLAEIPQTTFRSFELEETVDLARPLARVPLEVEAAEVLGATETARATTRAALGTAAMLTGLAQTMLNMTVEYVKERKQFGAPIGSFQAVKHHLANVRIAIEFTDPMIAAAAWAVDTEQADGEMLVAMAKVRANTTARLAATTCLQCHGAIGYSYEHDLGLWMKRAWALSESWGSSSAMRRAAGAALGMTPSK
ncbi:MAG: acyl-CoA dehydrogenase family protein [Acidimicrobiia bacterium]